MVACRSFRDVLSADYGAALRQIAVFRSTDQGQTWTADPDSDLHISGQNPAVIRLRDGRCLMTFTGPERIHHGQPIGLRGVVKRRPGQVDHTQRFTQGSGCQQTAQQVQQRYQREQHRQKWPWRKGSRSGVEPHR